MDALSSGLRSPPLSRSNAASPRPKFDGGLLKTYMKMLLSTTLQSKAWAEVKDREKLKAITKELGERVKERMVEIQPRGLYVCLLAALESQIDQHLILRSFASQSYLLPTLERYAWILL
jgi:hypothetical protein